MEIKHRGCRFYAKTAHGTAELLYKIIDKETMSIYHTFTPEEDRGQRVAEQLTKMAFEFAKKNELKVRPDCPYVWHFLERHKEWHKYTTETWC